MSNAAGIDLGVMAPYGSAVMMSAPFLRDYVSVLERAGVESFWAVEHVVMAEDYQPNYPYSPGGRVPSAPGAVPMHDPFELLSFVAAWSTTLRLGTAVVVAPLHSPAVLAKRAATLDLLSGGRLMLGLGIGWQREEYAAVGAPFAGRGRRLDECIAAMRVLWEPGPSTFHGDTVSFDAVHLVPKPAPRVFRSCSVATRKAPSRVPDASATDGFPMPSAPTSSPTEWSRCTTQLAPPGVIPPRSPSPCGREARIRRESGTSTGSAGSSMPARKRLVVRVGADRPDDLAKVSEQLDRYREEIVGRL